MGALYGAVYATSPQLFGELRNSVPPLLWSHDENGMLDHAECGRVQER